MILQFIKKLIVPIILLAIGYLIATYTSASWAWPVSAVLALITSAIVLFRQKK